MGFRFRKSINIGGGFRINLSKTGVGYSWGLPGFRTTKLANGRNRDTLSVPGTGISYVEDSSGNRNQIQSRSDQISDAEQLLNNAVSVGTVNINHLQPVEYSSLLGEIAKIRKLGWLGIILICTIVFALFSKIFLVTGCVGILLLIYVYKVKPIQIDYSFDSHISEQYKILLESLQALNHSIKVEEILSKSSINKERAFAGAQTGIGPNSTKDLHISYTPPWFLKLNIDIIAMTASKATLLFLPDKLLVYDGYRTGAINYSSLNIVCTTVGFMLDNDIPSDAQIVSHRWEKMNKDGSPDKRYKDNHQFSVCRYGKVDISAVSGLNLELLCSNIDAVSKFAESLISAKIIPIDASKLSTSAADPLFASEEDKAQDNIVDTSRIVTVNDINKEWETTKQIGNQNVMLQEKAEAEVVQEPEVMQRAPTKDDVTKVSAPDNSGLKTFASTPNKIYGVIKPTETELPVAQPITVTDNIVDNTEAAVNKESGNHKWSTKLPFKILSLIYIAMIVILILNGSTAVYVLESIVVLGTLFAFCCAIIGVLKPDWVYTFWNPPTRGRTCISYIGITIVFFIIFCIFIYKPK